MKDLPPSPFAPQSYDETPVIKGLRLSTVESNLRYKNRKDLLLAHFPEGANLAGVFTLSQTRAAPVLWSQQILKNKGKLRAILINAGNANAYTGQKGRDVAKFCADKLASGLNCAADDIALASTGVIGQQLNGEGLSQFFPTLCQKDTDATDGDWHDAACAIMTTDTFVKRASVTCHIDGVPVTIAGIAKGSGMIAPNMATMLAMLVTDAAIPQDLLQKLLSTACDKSFNAITVDGDTSTNDTVFLAATGSASHPSLEGANPASPLLTDFARALDLLCHRLAQMVITDGEGISKLIEVTVTGAQNDKAAKTIALSIANSPLVKTAIAGGDANWGRVIMAAGKAGIAFDQDQLSLKFGDILVVDKGTPSHQDQEAALTQHFKGGKIIIGLDMHQQNGAATVWGCDLTHGYIDINADYRS